jgi:two-component system response regulator NreC
VLVADDHAGLRRSLRLLIDHETDMQVVGEAGDVASTLRQARRTRPHVLVLDLELPDVRYGEAVSAVRRALPGTALVLTTMHRSRGIAADAIRAGALGFVLKDTADAELAPAIRRAARGLKYVSPLAR